MTAINDHDRFLVYTSKDVLVESAPTKVRAMRAVAHLNDQAELNGRHTTYYWKDKNDGRN